MYVCIYIYIYILPVVGYLRLYQESDIYIYIYIYIYTHTQHSNIPITLHSIAYFPGGIITIYHQNVKREKKILRGLRWRQATEYYVIYVRIYIHAISYWILSALIRISSIYIMCLYLYGAQRSVDEKLSAWANEWCWFFKKV
jgi:hypothetical protein